MVTDGTGPQPMCFAHHFAFSAKDATQCPSLGRQCPPNGTLPSCVPLMFMMKNELLAVWPLPGAAHCSVPDTGDEPLIFVCMNSETAAKPRNCRLVVGSHAAS